MWADLEKNRPPRMSENPSRHHKHIFCDSFLATLFAHAYLGSQNVRVHVEVMPVFIDKRYNLVDVIGNKEEFHPNMNSCFGSVFAK